MADGFSGRPPELHQGSTVVHQLYGERHRDQD
jgi:hypothetical protein